MGRRPPMGHGKGLGLSGPTREECKGTAVVAAPRRPSPNGFVVVVLLRAPILVLGLRVDAKTRRGRPSVENAEGRRRRPLRGIGVGSTAPSLARRSRMGPSAAGPSERRGSYRRHGLRRSRRITQLNPR